MASEEATTETKQQEDTKNDTKIPTVCDYLVVGGGATGMAFVDSLLKSMTANITEEDEKDPTKMKLKVVLLDKHASPGGQWHDSYDFVKLHQPSAGYGVESMALENPRGDKDHLASRQEILEYYQKVAHYWTAKGHLTFVGNAKFHFQFNKSPGADGAYKFDIDDPNTFERNTHSMEVKRRLVDARYLEPDLPSNTPPKFEFDHLNSEIVCLPVNQLTSNPIQSASKAFVVIGAGKTGMDAVYYLLTNNQIVDPTKIVWVMPHDPWITARENIGTCMEFLHETATAPSKDLNVQQTFAKWEQEGKVYRIFEEPADTNPTKFKDATLSKEELEVLRTMPASNVIRGKGRVASIQNDGRLLMDDGAVVELPFWKDGDNVDIKVADITYVHCSAGAFNYTKQIGNKPVPVFTPERITIQDVYGTPGFCFVGSILGKLESIASLTDEQRNKMCLTPHPTQQPSGKLGFTSGDIGTTLTKDHGYVQRLLNLKGWLEVEEVRNWLVGHRLFNLGHYGSVEDIDKLVNETWTALQEQHGFDKESVEQLCGPFGKMAAGSGDDQGCIIL